MRVKFIGGPWDGKVKIIARRLQYFEVADMPPAPECVSSLGADIPTEDLTFKTYMYRLVQYDCGEYVYICQR